MSPARLAVAIAGDDLDGRAGPEAPGPAGPAALLLFLVGFRLQVQLHEHRRDALPLRPASGPSARSEPAAKAEIRALLFRPRAIRIVIALCEDAGAGRG